MSDFNIHTDFYPGDEIKIVFDISNDVPTTSDKTVYIVDLQEGSPHSVTVPLKGGSSEYYTAENENTVWSNVRAMVNGETNAD